MSIASRPPIRLHYAVIASLALVGIAAHVTWRWLASGEDSRAFWPLYLVLLLGGTPLVAELAGNLWRREFGADLLAGISIVTAVLLGEYLAGALVVLMLSGGETLESYAVRRASSVLAALSRRMPSVAHRRVDSVVQDVPLAEVHVGDILVVHPHEICPVDGIVVEGHGVMDESYLTGEPYLIQKTPGSTVLSGAINGDSLLTIRAVRAASDSRYAQIMRVMEASQQQRPRLRRLGDQLGAVYTPFALAIGVGAWLVSGEPVRFLAVMVIATPCPLLIAIPVAIIGAISLAAQRAIVIRDPVVLERIPTCKTVIFDKTGTLTYGEPSLVELIGSGVMPDENVLSLVASVEQYSKHPLAQAIVRAARERGVVLHEASEVHEPPGRGLEGVVNGHRVRLVGRAQLGEVATEVLPLLPPQSTGLECIVIIDDRYAATFRFRDRPRREGAKFIDHLKPRHHVDRIILLSGDRESEVRYLADLVGVKEVYAEKSPEQKVAVVRAETARAPTLFVGDGINDAPALLEATVGVAFGQQSDITVEAAGAVVMDSSLEKIDELWHLAEHMRAKAIQSAAGGMALSVGGMMFAAAGLLPPVAGAVSQEIIDVAAVLNALRAAWPPRSLRDF